MAVSIETDGEIAVVTIDKPPVNALDQALRHDILDAVETLDADGETRVVVLLAAGRTFIAGGDLAEFDKPPQPPHLPDVIARIEASGKPWVAALHGTAIGGGLEVALGCHYRLALPSVRLVLPEATIGVIPDAGDTVCLPRLIAVETALDMVTSGKLISAVEGRDAGLLDRLVEGDLRAGALAFARERCPGQGRRA